MTKPPECESEVVYIFTMFSMPPAIGNPPAPPPPVARGHFSIFLFLFSPRWFGFVDIFTLLYFIYIVFTLYGYRALHSLAFS